MIALLELLTAILEEIFGTKNKKPAAQPRRQVRQSGSGGPTARQSADMDAEWSRPGQDTAREDLQDVVRKLFGMEEQPQAREEAPPPPPPPPRQQQQQRKQKQPRRTASVKPTPENLLPEATVEKAYQSWTPPGEVSAPGLSGALAPARKSAEAGLPPDFVAKLRNNPRAAREAFVYQEIFGPPLADR